MYALRYASPPVVRRTGGLADTVEDATPAALRDRTATGFGFDECTADGLRDAMARAITLHRDPEAWRRVQLTGMAKDFGWEHSARRYAELYRGLTEGGQRAAMTSVTNSASR